MLLIILFLFILCLIIFFFISFTRKNNALIIEDVSETISKCCGAHSVCEQDTLLSSSNIISYYNDVDLDVLAGISPVNFTDEQLKLLSDVFFSLKESDTAGWLRSLQMRNIQLPVELREQALLIVSERRIA